MEGPSGDPGAVGRAEVRVHVAQLDDPVLEERRRGGGGIRPPGSDGVSN